MHKRLRLTALILTLVLAGCQSAALRQSPLPPGNGAGGALVAGFDPNAQSDSSACEKRVNDTVARVEQCISRASLWRRLSHFQEIADENPGRDGHGNRDTGTPGYAASVAYVASLMRRAGYKVEIQRYVYTRSDVRGTPEFRAAGHSYEVDRDWFVARRSGGGTVAASIEVPRGSGTGCTASDFDGFVRGRVALLERGPCDFDAQVANAQAAGASAAILWDSTPEGVAYEARLVDPAAIPVVGVVDYAVGTKLAAECGSASAPRAFIDVRLQRRSDVDYNVVADSPFGDARRVVVIDGHLDSIHGAGMLDNASGSTTILEVALSMAKTPTRNRLRYIWFGGEEIGLLGSRYYTTHLTAPQLRRIAFDVDVDVTATPNFDILIADPKFASKVEQFPPNVVPQSKLGNDYFYEYFDKGGVVSRPARFGNDGTDSLEFALRGVPDTGILTQQDCCKQRWETKLWGGFRGNYEGSIPSFNGGCVDRPHRWCDNLSNNDPFVLELASSAVAYVTFELANRRNFPR